MTSLASDPARVSALLADIEASPTPYHAAATAAERLIAAGFTPVDISGALPDSPGRYFIVVGGSLTAWVVPEALPAADLDYVVIGAHTDSPNLRVRAHPDVTSAGWAQVGMEIYGGVLLNSWLDRDLGIAGRVTILVDGTPEQRLMLDDRPLLRVPQLAIHLDREIREKGLLLNPQEHLTPLWAVGEDAPSFLDYLADQLDVASDAIVAWDLMAFDTQAPSIAGLNNDLIASARIDNQFSSFCAVQALVELVEGDTEPMATIPVVVLYDHEEIGSTSATGADGALLPSLLERISSSVGVDRIGHLEALTRSLVISADGAHATNPNYAEKHEPSHQINVNSGLVIKTNANQRYATDAISAGRFRAACDAAGVPLQTYVHRNDLPCGSTIGPITAGQLGVPTVDVGAPQLAMHSVREMAGTADVHHLIDALKAAVLHAS